MDWSDITLKQYLNIIKVANKGDEFENALAIMNLLYGKDYENEPLSDYFDKLKEISFINTPIKPKDIGNKITINEREYKVCYNIHELPAKVFFVVNEAMKNTDYTSIQTVIFNLLEGNYSDDVKKQDCLDIDMQTLMSIITKVAESEDKYVEHLLKQNVGMGITEIMKLKIPFQKKIELAVEMYKQYKNAIKLKTGRK